MDAPDKNGTSPKTEKELLRIIAMLLAPRHLNREQGAAVYDYRIGRWSPERSSE